MSWLNKFAAKGSMRHIGIQLERIADCLEHVCREQYGYNVRPPKADTSGPEPVTSYVNEEEDAYREFVEAVERAKGKVIDEEA